MVMKFLRENVWAAVALTLIRIYLGWQWMEAGWHKLTGDQAFSAAGFLKNAITNPVADKATQEAIYPTYTAFLENFALPNVKIINFLIPLGEFLVGLGLIVGGLTAAAAFFGLMMNFLFLFAGTVSTNPWLTLIGVIVLFAGANAGKFGLDYFLLPWIRKGWAKLTKRGGGQTTQARL
ncbi:DoxX family protein [Cohnella cholangitidis]|uniref:DoxX family protein n=1 Tax=Cohnella cholangitidis TaxID=2598458 RepID=A0A7G5C1K5_9BACL|nr:DoxX family protein [Cohnella cholangitidis]QMV43089.1 DoxX family protein [Cohnella cholangitidis]